MKNKKGQPPKKPAPKISHPNSITSNSREAQRVRALQALNASTAGVTTIELREKHDCMMPAARIHELRWQFGFNIQRVWTIATNAQGNLHRIARYVLQPGKWKGVA